MRRQNKSTVLSVRETAFFCEQAAMILKSGLPLEENLIAMCEEAADKNGFEPLSVLSKAIQETGRLAEALKIAPVLPEYAIQMIDIGDASGTLDEVLDGLGDYYMRTGQIKDRIRSAVTYPAVLTLLMGGVIAVLLFRVLPVFAKVLDSMGAGGTRTGEVVTRIGVILGGTSMGVTIAILGLIVAASWSLRGGPGGDRINRLLMRIGPVKRIMRTLTAERFSSVMAMLVKTGYPLEEAVLKTSGLPVDAESRARIRKAYELLVGGERFAKAVESTGIFDTLHIRMLDTAASAGMLDASLDKLSGIYAEQLDRDISLGEAMIEPALVALLAIVAGAVLLSLMIPLANMLTGMI